MLNKAAYERTASSPMTFSKLDYYYEKVNSSKGDDKAIRTFIDLWNMVCSSTHLNNMSILIPENCDTRDSIIELVSHYVYIVKFTPQYRDTIDNAMYYSEVCDNICLVLDAQTGTKTLWINDSSVKPAVVYSSDVAQLLYCLSNEQCNTDALSLVKYLFMQFFDENDTVYKRLKIFSCVSPSPVTQLKTIISSIAGVSKQEQVKYQKRPIVINPICWNIVSDYVHGKTLSQDQQDLLSTMLGQI